MKKTILVTGGAGFIGSAIVPLLSQAGYDVYVMDDLSFGKRDHISIADDHFFQGSILDRKFVFGCIGKIRPDCIIHLAAIHFIPYCNQFPYESARVNIEGTINVLDAAKANKEVVTKFIFASTAAVYPITDYAVSETHEAGPMDIYGLSKLAGEKLVRGFHLETEIPSIVCRFYNAFGPNETNAHLFPEIERQVKEGLRIIKLGNLEPKRDFIHTHDMATAILALLKSDKIDKYAVFNLARGIEYSVREVVEAFERQLGETIQIEVDPARVRKVERMHLLADITQLKKATGWEPKWSLDEGIKNLLHG